METSKVAPPTILSEKAYLRDRLVKSDALVISSVIIHVARIY